MSYKSLALIFILSSFYISSSAISNPVSFSFPSFSPNDPKISITKGTTISGGSLQLTDSQLTSKITNNSATAYYTNPIQLWSPSSNSTASFDSYFEFAIAFPDASQSSENSGGFSFFLAPQSSVGNLVSFTNSSGKQRQLARLLAVEFVSFRDNQSSNGTGSDTLAARLSYDGTNNTLVVDVVSQQINSTLYKVSKVVDLRDVLPESVLVGFAASNGSSVVVQKINKWNFTYSEIQNITKGNSGVRFPPPQTKPFKIWLLAPIVGFVLAVVATIVVCCLCEGALKNRILDAMRILVVEILMLVSLLFCCCEFGRKLLDNISKWMLRDTMEDEFARGTGPRRFSYKELASATNNFSEKRKLGEGGFGIVYKGFLSKVGQEVAVKKISRKSKQGKKEFASEVKIISSLRHRNLVRLIGWCNDRDKLLLVYEFLPNGSLDEHLFNKRTSLPWRIRYNIATGLASALLYLHEEWEQCVVHRDIKPNNVMLDSDFNAKLGDFGLARLVDHKLGQQTTLPAGTIGYLAPECFITRKASKESDVYSFGIVALEISTGRRAVEHDKSEDEVRLVEWVWNLNGIDRLFDTVDASLDMEFDERQMECLLLVGLWCAHPDQSQRPSMRQVIQALNFEVRVPALPRTMPVPIFAPPLMDENNSYHPSLTSSLVVGR